MKWPAVLIACALSGCASGEPARESEPASQGIRLDACDVLHTWQYALQAEDHRWADDEEIASLQRIALSCQRAHVDGEEALGARLLLELHDAARPPGGCPAPGGAWSWLVGAWSDLPLLQEGLARIGVPGGAAALDASDGRWSWELAGAEHWLETGDQELGSHPVGASGQIAWGTSSVQWGTWKLGNGNGTLETVSGQLAAPHMQGPLGATYVGLGVEAQSTSLALQFQAKGGSACDL